MRVSVAFLVVLGLCRGDSFLDKFRYGIELVHRLLSSDPTSNVGAFFGGAFKGGAGRTEKTGDEFANDLFTAVVDSIGGSQREMGVAGIRISVLVSKLISDAFPMAGRTSRASRGDRDPSPLAAVLAQPRMRELIAQARDPDLTDRIRRVVDGSAPGKSGDCVRLLMCKLSPFVRGMQRSLLFFAGVDRGGEEIWAGARPVERMYLFLPTMREFIENGDVCEESHPECVY